MRILLIILLATLSTTISAQSWKKYSVGKSGCSAYFRCDPGTFSLDMSQDSSEVYTGECSHENIFYGIICVKLKTKISDLQASEEMLISYLDYLKGSLKITGAVGYGKGHRLRNNENTRGVIDYWKDSDSNWKIKGWTDGKYIGVMYVYTKGEVPEALANFFLESFGLPS